MSDEQARVVTTVEDGVAEVCLNRPSKHNGLDVAMFEGIAEAGEALIADNRVRAVVLHGAGKSFCAGLDFKAFMAGGEAAREKLLERPEGAAANLAQQVGWVWQLVPVPVIAAVEGSCIGGGLQIALGADIRLLHPEAKMAVREIHYGLIPDMGITATLPRGVAIDAIKELTFTGRVVEAPEAVALGLATRISAEPLTEARELARTIAARSPDAVRASKTLWNQAVGLSPADTLALETRLQLPLLGSPNQLEAVRSAFMKDAPRFKDPS
jgi:enoyl-CoA hydratase/carnithine racemase